MKIDGENLTVLEDARQEGAAASVRSDESGVGSIDAIEAKLEKIADAYIAANPGNFDYPPELEFSAEDNEVCDVDGPQDAWMAREAKLRARMHFISASGLGLKMAEDLFRDLEEMNQ